MNKELNELKKMIISVASESIEGLSKKLKNDLIKVLQEEDDDFFNKEALKIINNFRNDLIKITGVKL